MFAKPISPWPRAIPTAIFLAFATLLAGGCTSPSSSSAPAVDAPVPAAPPAPAAPSALQQLRKGLPSAEVIALLGEPQERKRITREGVEAWIWIYQRTYSGPKRQVTTSMREVPYVDPITGVMRMLQEPVYEIESTYITETTELLLHAGLLLEWKQHRTTDRDFK